MSMGASKATAAAAPETEGTLKQRRLKAMRELREVIHGEREKIRVEEYDERLAANRDFFFEIHPPMYTVGGQDAEEGRGPCQAPY